MLPIPSSHRHTPSRPELRQMLAYYFGAYPEGDLHLIHERIVESGLFLVELEYYIRRIAPQATTIADWIEKTPTRANLLAYALEVFHDLQWEGVDISPERRQLVKTLRSLCGVVRPVPTAPEPEALKEEELDLLERAMEEEFDHLMRKIARRERNRSGKLASLFSSRGTEGSC